MKFILPIITVLLINTQVSAKPITQVGLFNNCQDYLVKVIAKPYFYEVEELTILCKRFIELYAKKEAKESIELLKEEIKKLENEKVN